MKVETSSNVVDEGVRCEELEKVIIDADVEKYFQVGVQLPPQEKEELLAFFRKNIDVFAWNAYETSGVDPNFICHHLNVNPIVSPKKQPHRRSSKEHAKVVKEEVMKLKRAGAIREVFCPKMAGQYNCGKEEIRKVESLCRFY